MTTQTSRLEGQTSAEAIKAPCKATSDSNLTLSGEQTIDSQSCVSGDRVLVKSNTDTTENGIYVVSTSAWSRADDFNGARDVTQGTRVYVANGSNVGDYILDTANPITIGTSNLTFNFVPTAEVTSLDQLAGDSDDITQGSVNLYMTLSERSKLSGIAPLAEVNDDIVAGANISVTGGNGNDWTIDGGAGSTTVSGDDVVIDNSSFDVLTGTDSQTLWEENDIALLNARSTGVRYGGNLTDQGSGVVRIAAGAGQILNNADPQNPTFISASWPQADLDLSASDDVYYIYVNGSNVVTSTTTIPENADYRTSIWLWRVSIRSGVVSGTASIAQPVQQAGPQNWDIWKALGNIKSGLTLSAASTDLTVEMGAGEAYITGSNFFTDATDPNTLRIPLDSGLTFRHIDQDGDQTADRTTLDASNYDNGGTIAAVGGGSNAATIMTHMYFPTADNHRIFYGQTVYNNNDAAYEALTTGLYAPVFPTAFDNALILGYYIVEKNATNLADGTQIVVTTNKFGLLGGSTATTGAGGFLSAADIGVTVQGYDADTAKLDVEQTWTEPQKIPSKKVFIGSTTKTLALTDAGTLQATNNVGGCTITIPLNSSVAFVSEKTDIEVLNRAGGTVIVRGATGVTINGNDEAGGGESDITISQYSSKTFIMIGTNSWIAF